LRNKERGTDIDRENPIKVFGRISLMVAAFETPASTKATDYESGFSCEPGHRPPPLLFARYTGSTQLASALSQNGEISVANVFKE
jgi:hypothetical protein